MIPKAISITKPKENYARRLGFYFITLFLVGVFTVIVHKNVSLPSMVIIPVGLLVILSLFVITFFNPFIPFLMLVAYVPFCRILVGDFGTGATALNFTNILIVIILFGWIARALTGKRFFKHVALNIPIFILCLFAVISLLQGAFQYAGGYAEHFVIPLKRWLTPIFLYFISLNMIKNKEDIKKVIIIIMIATVAISAMAIKEYMNYGDRGSLERSRIGGVFEQPNLLGAYLVYMIFLFLGFYLLNIEKPRYWLFLILSLICFRGIMVAFSRGAYIAFAFGLLVITFFRSKVIFTILVVLMIFAILNPIFLPGGIRYRMSMTSKNEGILSTDTQQITDPSVTNRLEIWKGAIRMIKDHPFGTGYGTFPFFIPYYTAIEKRMDAHNTYLILAAEMGIHTLTIFLVILFILFKNTLWLYKKIKDRFIRAVTLGFLGSLGGLVMANMFGSRLITEELSSYFWILAGLIMSCVIMKKKKEIV